MINSMIIINIIMLLIIILLLVLGLLVTLHCDNVIDISLDTVSKIIAVIMFLTVMLFVVHSVCNLISLMY